MQGALVKKPSFFALEMIMDRKCMWMLGWLLGVFTLVACDSKGDSQIEENGYIEITESGASTVVMEGYSNASSGFSVLKPTGFATAFYIKEKAFVGENYSFVLATEKRLDAMTEIPAADRWQATVFVTEGSTYWARCEGADVCRYLKARVAYIEGNRVGMEYMVSSQVTPGLNENSNVGYQSVGASVMNLEIPALDAGNQYVAYEVDYQDKRVLNFALEYVAAKKHSAWVAFCFDAQTSQDNVNRTNMWEQDDPNIDNSVEVTESMHKSDGYDKGHLVASEDRVYCKEANEQTFYYANISPQIGSFNQKYWAALEAQVRKWGRSTQQGTYDKVYVAKGGTLNKLLTNFTGTQKANDGLYPTTDAKGKTVKGLVVPAYYYMAILAEKAGKYNAIAFYVPHSELLPQKPTAGDFQVYAVTIDRLEQETGIDFFCNLPDVIEREVESTYNVADWAW